MSEDKIKITPTIAGMNRDKMHEVAGVPTEKVLKDLAEAAEPPEKTPAPEQVMMQTPDVEANIDARIAYMEQALAELKKGRNGVKVVQASGKVLDFSKLSENAVYDMSIPIEAIPHSYLDPTQIKLKDSNYCARFVNISPRNMGPRKAVGYTFVEKEDIDFTSLPMGMDLEPDENGHYGYIDTVLMKIPKKKYFAALRAKHIQAMAVVDRKRAIEIGKATVEAELRSGTDDKGLNYGNDYSKAQQLGAGGKPKMEVYI